MKRAVITGIYGQDGSFMCEYLLQKGYEVFGISRKNLSARSSANKKELEKEGIYPRVENVNLYDYEEMEEYIRAVNPHEFYHLATYHVSAEGKGNGDSIREQDLFNKNVLAAANILECCYKYASKCKVLTAGSCLMFDDSDTCIQDENTPYKSKSLYGLAKISENHLVQYYRRLGLFACTAILYNHESHRRSDDFVTKKIVENLIKVQRGRIQQFTLGNLEVEKDWGYAGDYVAGMYLMLQNSHPKDYILSTGELHTIREFIEECAEQLMLSNWEKYVHIDESIIMRKFSAKLQGDCGLAINELGWNRTKTFKELINEMITKSDQIYLNGVDDE